MQNSESANRSPENLDNKRFYGDTVVTDPTMFRVSPVMTTSIRLHIY
ncbi:MAG: hypothetical protein IJ027_01690 [Oscillospiraceae bacterium]|nr:hypothetical protein [Oscillospiraceae bacterium]